MSASESAISVVKSVLMFKDTLARIDKDLAGLKSDLTDLSKSHADVDKRLVRVETIVEMAMAGRQAESGPAHPKRIAEK
jgi:hypothetical protein